MKKNSLKKKTRSLSLTFKRVSKTQVHRIFPFISNKSHLPSSLIIFFFFQNSNNTGFGICETVIKTNIHTLRKSHNKLK